MRKSIAVIGGQLGDEGKGKIVDYVVQQAAQKVHTTDAYHRPILVRRYQGGANAGHTLTVNGQRHALHLVPSGILEPQAYNLIDQQVFVNPRFLVEEIQRLQTVGVAVSPDNLGIAANAQVTLDYHVADDQVDYTKKQRSSTGNGIRQTAVDKQNRVGIRFVEFLDQKAFRNALKERFPNGFPEQYDSLESFIDSYAAERDFLQGFVTQSHVANKRHGRDYEIWEGAQGVLIDVDVGLYPDVTSSNPAFIPGKTDLRLGVFKLYKSSAGTGKRPFVSQMPQKLQRTVRKPWGEFGTTTHKPRDIGWFDAVAAKYAVEAAQIDVAVFTCGDKMELLSQLGVKPKIVVSYDVGGIGFREWNHSFHKRGFLHHVTPVFEEFEPWRNFTEQDGRSLTPQAACYVRRIEELLERECILIGTGPGREEMIVRKNPYDLI
ncbi:adenylosuccinate synthetase [Candidatus Woesearchaeota archaeon]|nr:hypothetical protein [uncultured archaeon]MBS3169376.1 adenylosuccinate synthetase [Candidatus Woesearchaeota archaeon]